MAHPTSRGFHRGTGDESNSPVLELLLGGELTATDSRALHIAAADDRDTDWNVAASVHPIVYYHSGDTPATNFFSITHDATSAILNTASGTLVLQIDGTTELSLSGTVFDLAGVNLQMQTSGIILDNNGNQLISFPAAITSAVNELTISNAITANPPILEATGGGHQYRTGTTAQGNGRWVCHCALWVIWSDVRVTGGSGCDRSPWRSVT